MNLPEASGRIVGLKRELGLSDGRGMGKHEAVCPICDADLPLAGDEHTGEEVYCTVCGAPCKLKSSSDGEGFDAEEDM